MYGKGKSIPGRESCSQHFYVLPLFHNCPSNKSNASLPFGLPCLSHVPSSFTLALVLSAFLFFAEPLPAYNVLLRRLVPFSSLPNSAPQRSGMPS